jgi:hypothetical protein
MEFGPIFMKTKHKKKAVRPEDMIKLKELIACWGR